MTTSCHTCNVKKCILVCCCMQVCDDLASASTHWFGFICLQLNPQSLFHLGWGNSWYLSDLCQLCYCTRMIIHICLAVLTSALQSLPSYHQIILQVLYAWTPRVAEVNVEMQTGSKWACWMILKQCWETLDIIFNHVYSSQTRATHVKCGWIGWLPRP